MKDLLALIRRFLTVESLALFATGCLFYYIGVSLYNYYSGGQFSQRPALLLIVFVSLAFGLTTFVWLRFHPDMGYLPSPEINMLFGPIILLPFYFALQPLAIESLEGTPIWIKIIGGYQILPLLVITIQQIPMGWALDFAIIFTVLIGHLMRADNDQRLQSYAGGNEEERRT